MLCYTKWRGKTMASKNHPRYKLRKRMNSIKHEPKSGFNKRDIGKVIFYSLEDVSETLGDVVVITE